MLKYICTPHRDTDGPEELNNQAEADKEAEKPDEFSGLYVKYGNPATWTEFDDHMRQILVEHGPEQVE